MTPIPILLYHGIDTDVSEKMSSFTVSSDEFAHHMDLVVASGRRCLTVSELVDEMQAASPRLDNVVLVTFDDGYRDFVDNAIPVMAARRVSSTIYITTGFVDGPGSVGVNRPDEPVMSWKQISDLPHAPCPVEVGAHSHSHPQMDTLSRAEVTDELVRSKGLLEDALGQPVRSFAYPHGYNSPRIRRQTRQAGYDSGAGVRNALSHDNDDVFCLARLTVRSFTTDEQIAEWISCRGASVASSGEALKTKGWRTYRRLKALPTGITGAFR